MNINTIRNMEARGAQPITSGAVTIHKVETALETAGIEFIGHGQPGVRLKAAADVVIPLEPQSASTVK